MCLTTENHFKSYSMPAIFTHFSLDKNKQPLFAISRKPPFRLLLFKQFRVSLFQKSLIGQDMKYINSAIEAVLKWNGQKTQRENFCVTYN